MSDSKQYKELGITCLKADDFVTAIDWFEKYNEQQGDDLSVFDMLGGAYLALGDRDSAVNAYTSALRIDPKHTVISLKLSRALLAGVNYLQALSAAHQQLKPQYYIEIGVCKGASFSLAHADCHAIGIDPEPQLDLSCLPEKHQVVSKTSDDYFSSSESVKEDLEGQGFDMAFLDGMHLFEYALRDFINLEKHAHVDSVVFIHDLYPLNAETARRERFANFWSGDVWKLALCLQTYRPDLEYTLLPCPPTGLALVKKLDSSSTVLQDHYDEIVEKYAEMSYSVLEKDKAKMLALTTTDHPLLIG